MRGFLTVMVTFLLAGAMPAQGQGGRVPRGEGRPQQGERTEQERAEQRERLEQRLQELQQRMRELRQQHGDELRQPRREAQGPEGRRRGAESRMGEGMGHRPLPPGMRREMMRAWRMHRGELRGPGARGFGGPEGMRRPPFRMGPDRDLRPGMRGMRPGMRPGMRMGMPRGMDRDGVPPRFRDGGERRPPRGDGQPPRRGRRIEVDDAPAPLPPPPAPRERAPGPSV